MRRRLAWVLLGAMAGLCGCWQVPAVELDLELPTYDDSAWWTPGAEGQASFSLERCRELLGCSIDRPFRVGHDNRLHVRLSGDLSLVSVRSTAAEVVVVEGIEEVDGELRADLRFVGEGDADLEVIDADGIMVDRLPVRARPAASLERNVVGSREEDAAVIEAGDEVLVGAEVLDAAGEELIAAGDVSWLVPSSDDVVRDNSNDTVYALNAVLIEAVAPGEITLVATLGELSLTVPVAVE